MHGQGLLAVSPHGGRGERERKREKGNDDMALIYEVEPLWINYFPKAPPVPSVTMTIKFPHGF